MSIWTITEVFLAVIIPPVHTSQLKLIDCDVILKLASLLSNQRWHFFHFFSSLFYLRFYYDFKIVHCYFLFILSWFLFSSTTENSPRQMHHFLLFVCLLKATVTIYIYICELFIKIYVFSRNTHLNFIYNT